MVDPLSPEPPRHIHCMKCAQSGKTFYLNAEEKRSKNKHPKLLVIPFARLHNSRCAFSKVVENGNKAHIIMKRCIVFFGLTNPCNPIYRNDGGD